MKIWMLFVASLILFGFFNSYSEELIEQNDDFLVMLGPGHGFEDQMKYLENTWPYNFSISIVRAESDPECHTGENSNAYYNVKVVNIDSLYLKWVSTSLSSPNTIFTLYYWYKTENTTFKVMKDTEYIVFLVPTHSNDVFSPTLITAATDENKNELTTNLTEHFKYDKNKES